MDDSNKDKNGMVADFQVICPSPMSKQYFLFRNKGRELKVIVLLLICCLCYPGHHRYRQCWRSIDAFIQFQLGPIGMFMGFYHSFVCMHGIHLITMCSLLSCRLLFNMSHRNILNICRLKVGVLNQAYRL